MTDFIVTDNYPSFAAAGCDYISRSTVGEVIETFDGETRSRRERVIITPAQIDMEGALCLGERSIRHMAHLLGMVDGWRAAQAISDNDRLVAERDSLSETLATMTKQMDVMRDQAASPTTIYVAADGSEHASKHAAVEKSERVLSGRRPKGQRNVRPISADEAPNPVESK